jgi:hypothetical protein
MFVGCYSTPNSSVSGSLVKVSEDDNYSTYVIIGAGVIRVKNDKEVTIVDNNTIGVSLYSIGYGSAKLGIISDIVTQSKPNSNNIIEIKKGFPFTGIDIKIKKEDGK